MVREKLASARPALKTVMGQCVVEAPLVEVARVLTDSSRMTEWVSGLVEERKVELDAELAFGDLPTAFVVYQHYTLMPLLSDRDYVISGRWSAAIEGEEVRSATLDLQSVVREDCPEVDGRVRAALNLLIYRLESRESGSHTAVSVQCNVDPLGALPQSMVNLYASSWPGKTLKSLQAQVQKVRREG